MCNVHCIISLLRSMYNMTIHYFHCNTLCILHHTSEVQSRPYGKLGTAFFIYVFRLRHMRFSSHTLLQRVTLS